ncbi:putative defense protein 3 [Littorina saxatilis]|uniref:Reelin domain-containing protein n=1 Tax=Littorina saxatilis TaxID=31220 RepID=A0AAN9GAF1_9CAEN
MWQVCFPLLLTSLLVTSSRGYPTGAPTEVCSSMFPHHGAEPQTSAVPYSITVESSIYTPGSTQTPIKVTVMSEDTAFKGLIVQARSLSDCNKTVGTFQLDQSERDLKLVTCRQANDGVTHTNKNVKTTKSFMWIPPATGMGHVYIRATVVQATEAFWNTVQSEIIFQGSNDATTKNTCKPPPTMENAAILDANLPSDNGNTGDQSNENHDNSHENDDDNGITDDGNTGASFSFSHAVMTLLFLVAVWF